MVSKSTKLSHLLLNISNKISSLKLKNIEKDSGKKFGDLKNPLLLSVRSGARVSMPGMMDTILNLGLNDKTVTALANKTSNMRFAKDSYRRFIQMYANVVMGVESYNFEELIENYKLTKGVLLDTDLDENDWDGLIKDLKNIVKEINKEKIKLIIENINKSLTLIEKVKKFVLINEEFTIENGMLTPTLKLKRKEIIKNYKQQLENLY